MEGQGDFQVFISSAGGPWYNKKVIVRNRGAYFREKYVLFHHRRLKWRHRMYETFEELGIVPQILKAVEDMGFEEPTPIQKAAIPPRWPAGISSARHRPAQGKRPLSGFPFFSALIFLGPRRRRWCCRPRESWRCSLPRKSIIWRSSCPSMRCRSTAVRISTASSGRCGSIRRSSSPRRAVSWTT